MSLRDRLQAAAHAHFVGRSAEVALFRDLLRPGPPPSQVVFVCGPGGVGKTALLREYEHVCAEAGVPCQRVDARDAGGAVPGLERLLAGAEPALGGDREPAGRAPDGSGRRVLLVDALDEVAGADDWLHRVLLPCVPDPLVVVFAGRRLPTGPWTSDPSWQALVRTVALADLSREEARALLARRGVGADQSEAALAFSRGHPLALTLVADAVERRPDVPFQPAEAIDVVETLRSRLFSDGTSASVLAAIEACATVRAATEPLLETLLDAPLEPGLFDAVRALPTVRTTADGLVLHDLARDVVVADLRWRAPERYAGLHARARRFYTDRLVHARTPDAQRAVLADYAFLYRDAPVAGPLLAQLRAALQGEGPLTMGPARPDEHAALQALVERHEGSEAAAVAAAWFGRPSADVAVVRDRGGEVRGLLSTVRLDATDEAERAADPVAAAVWDALRTSAARAGEAVLLFRSWADADAHQGVSPVQALLFARTVWEYLTTPGLAFSALVCTVPHGWASVLQFVGLRPLASGVVPVGETAYEAFGHDWRTVPPEVWLDSLAARPPGTPPRDVSEPAALVVLGRDDFAEAVLDALRALGRPGRLAESPLLQSRLVRDRVESGADVQVRADALRDLLVEAVGGVEEARRGRRYAAALEAMFVRPAPSQEVASERVGVPFSTFRRHLKRGVDLVVERLWAEETR